LPDWRIKLWDLSSGREICTLPHRRDFPNHDFTWDRQVPIALSPDGRILATRRAEHISLWSIPRGERLHRLNGRSYWVIMACVFSLDGKLLATGLEPYPELYDQPELRETVDLWDVTSGQRIRALEGDIGDIHPPHVRAVAFSPDGLILASGGLSGSIKLFDVATGAELRRLGPARMTETIAFSPDGRTLATEGGTLWDLGSYRTPRPNRNAEPHPSDPTTALAFSPDGQRIASGWTDGSIALCDRWSGTELRRLTAHKAPVESIAFLPDGRTLASESEDNTVRLWDAASGNNVITFDGLGQLLNE
jgi:WD40 repeat protein